MNALCLGFKSTAHASSDNLGVESQHHHPFSCTGQITDHETDHDSQQQWPDHVLDSHGMKTHTARVDFRDQLGDVYNFKNVFLMTQKL